ncbi:MAG: DNA-3-methyladenine glycosylase [Nocardioides sp.]
MDPTVAARRLLGARLTHRSTEGAVSVRLTEVEAYAGSGDPASHAFGGPTARNSAMFGPPDRLYVYRSHGLHWCANITCASPDEARGVLPGAILLRAGEVIVGAELALRRRGRAIAPHQLARGPGNLARALGLTGDHDGAEISVGPIELTRSLEVPTPRCGPRVGVSRAADRPWRFWLPGDPTVSDYRRSPRAAPSG